MITELYSGGTLLQYLRSYIKEDKLLDELEISLILKQLLDGLSYLSTLQIMHRDIKPENILFRESHSLQAVLADFGLAEYCYKPEMLFSRCGTPGFVAPEIANLKDKNVNYNNRCDVFSFGCVAHLLLLRKPVFYSKDYNQMLILNKEANIDFSASMYSAISATGKFKF